MEFRGRRTGVERRWLLAVLYTALTAVALLPIFSVTVPPLVDYPNHLARMHILDSWAETPELQRNYVVNWTLHPNMAMDMVVPLLARFMSVYTAGKLFVAASMLSLVAGTMLLRRVLHGRVGFLPALAFLLLYNSAFFWGFLNYLFAAGLALAGFAGWIALRARSGLVRSGLFTVFACILYVCHIFGLAIFGLLVLGYEIGRARSADRSAMACWTDWLAAGVPILVPGAHFLFWATANASPGPARTDFGSIADRAAILLSPVHFDMPWLDIATAAFLGIVWLIARSARGVALDPRLRIPLIVLAAAAVLMPTYLSGVWGIHIRLPVVLGCLLVAATRLDADGLRRMRIVVAMAIGLFAVRTGVIVDRWQELDGMFTEFRTASAEIEPGAKLLTVQDDADLPEGRSPLYGMQFWHMDALAVIERSAFVPTLFTGHTTVDGSVSVRHLETPVGNPLSRRILAMGVDAATSEFPLGYRLERYMWLYFIGWPAHFDYILSIRFGNEAPLYPDDVRPVASGSFFDIGRIR